MSGRKLPEILGWHEDWPDGFSTYKVWWKDGAKRPLGWMPTVDDLLAWLLAGRCEVVDAHSFELADERGLSHVVSCSDGDRWTEYRAPTLLAALEAAVRAVAGEDE